MSVRAARCQAPCIDPPTVTQDATKGPQFLWQLTDVESIGGGETAKPTRTSRDGKNFVALFGKESGNAAITTLQMDPGDGNGLRLHRRLFSKTPFRHVDSI